MQLISGERIKFNTKTTNNSITKWARTWIDTSLKRTYGWPTDKRCSKSLIIRKMQIKTTRNYHLRAVRMAISSKSKNKCWWGCRERGTLLHVGVNADSTTAVESSMEIPQKIKDGTALWPSNPTSGNISEETWTTNLKEYKHPYVHWSIIYSHQDNGSSPSVYDE